MTILHSEEGFRVGHSFGPIRRQHPKLKLKLKASYEQENGTQTYKISRITSYIAMANQGNTLLLTSNGSAPNSDGDSSIPQVKRSDFPEDFSFGAATSAYQVEGAWNVGGKGMSNWDIFSQRDPARIADGSNGCTAIDHYHLYKDDVAFMKKVGPKSYRFSISWGRILPGGRIYAGISREGIKFYNDLIDELIVADKYPL